MPKVTPPGFTDHAKRLIQAHDDHGGSLQAFADDLGVARSNLWLMIKGKREMSYSVIKGLVKLGYNPLWVINGEGKPKASTAEAKKIFDVQMIRTEIQIANKRIDVLFKRQEYLEKQNADLIKQLEANKKAV